MVNNFDVLGKRIKFGFYGSGFIIKISIAQESEGGGSFSHVYIEYGESPNFHITLIEENNFKPTLEELYSSMSGEQKDVKLELASNIPKPSWTVGELLEKAIAFKNKKSVSETLMNLSRREAKDSGFLIGLKVLEASIKGYTGNEEKLTIPSFINSSPVTKIEERAFCGSTISDLTVGFGTTTLESKCFADSSLRSLTLPTSITSIAPDAFEGMEDTLTINCTHGSYISEWLIENGLNAHVEVGESLTETLTKCVGEGIVSSDELHFDIINIGSTEKGQALYVELHRLEDLYDHLDLQVYVQSLTKDSTFPVKIGKNKEISFRDAVYEVIKNNLSPIKSKGSNKGINTSNLFTKS